MEFWGIEVKAGQPIKSSPGANNLIHLSQATIGESKNKPEAVPLYLNVDGKKLILGTLSHQNNPQLCFDLVFEKDFELSHNWKNGSVYFLGYKSSVSEEVYTDSEEESSEEEAEELPVVAAENGKPKTDAKPAKANAVKPNDVKEAVKIAEPSKKNEDDDDDDDSDSEDGSGSDDEDDSEDEENEISMDGISDDEDEETPKKVESSKKRPAEAATPVSAKKAKSAVTPQKTGLSRDCKKGGHVATPHPSKQAAKTSGKSPKTGGQFSCGTCSKTFISGGGLESHKKAKHGGK